MIIIDVENLVFLSYGFSLTTIMLFIIELSDMLVLNAAYLTVNNEQCPGLREECDGGL